MREERGVVLGFGCGCEGGGECAAIVGDGGVGVDVGDAGAGGEFLWEGLWLEW